jgi:hypothetical protein
MISQKLTALFDAVEDTIGGNGILRRDIEPYVEQVLAGVACKLDSAHALTP